MEISCPHCKTGPVDLERSKITLRETGYLKCPQCNHRFLPREEQKVTVDLQDRIEVLTGLQRQLQSRVLAVSIPNDMLAMAERLERQAEEIFDKAQRIRANLATDTAQVKDLLRELECVEIEIMACRHCVIAKMKPTKGMLRSVVEDIMRTKGD